MWCSLELLVSKELISHDHMLYSDEVIVGHFLNEKDVLSGWYSGMGKLGDCHSNQNGVEPGANVSWFKTHNATQPS